MGWIEVVKNILKMENYTSEKSVGLIVDHDYCKISRFNLREIPILGMFFLPRNFTLIYASSDTGRSFVLSNKFFAWCDKEAKKALKDSIEKRRTAVPRIFV